MAFMKLEDLQEAFESKYSQLIDEAQFSKAQCFCIDTKHIIDDMLDKTDETVAFREHVHNKQKAAKVSEYNETWDVTV